MAISYSATILNGIATDLATAVAGGTLRLRATSTTVCDIPLAATAFNVSGAVLTARGGDGSNPISGSNKLTGTTAAAGTINNYQVLNSGGTVVWSNSDTTGLTMGSFVVGGSGQTIEVTGWTHTVS